MSALHVTGITARYPGHPVLHGTDLHVESGTLVALLGPSGCGKTTLLRTIAGFHPATSGEVHVGERMVEGPGVRVPSHRRRITVVPQDGSLFPHLDVAMNVAFGLKGRPRDDVRHRVDHMLELVGLQDERHRQPHELSGGQRRRVALARALAPTPDLVLLDEPFSSLDAQLREQVREQVRELLLVEKATALLVTHDQSEALSMADEVAVMREGVVPQQDAPPVVYSRPVDAWTARFVGDSVVLDATVADGLAHTVLGSVPVDGPMPADGAHHSVLLRPEQLTLGAGSTAGRVLTSTFRGHESVVLVALADGERIAVRTPGAGPAPGSDVALGVSGSGWLLPDEPR